MADLTPRLTKQVSDKKKRDQFLAVATAMAQGLLADPSIDWDSKKVARTAVQFAKDLIHEVETTEL